MQHEPRLTGLPSGCLLTNSVSMGSYESSLIANLLVHDPILGRGPARCSVAGSVAVQVRNDLLMSLWSVANFAGQCLAP